MRKIRPPALSKTRYIFKREKPLDFSRAKTYFLKNRKGRGPKEDSARAPASPRRRRGEKRVPIWNNIMKNLSKIYKKENQELTKEIA